MDIYRSLGGDEQSLAAGFNRISNELRGDMARVERWRICNEEWSNMTGEPMPVLTGPTLMRLIGIKF